MRLLLDTHFLLWALIDSPKLTEQARKVIIDEYSDIYFSVASLWEIQIKHQLHPASFPDPRVVERYCNLSGYKRLPIEYPEVLELENLCFTGNHEHKDPFDRMLICQAKTYDMLLLTADSKLKGYNEACVRFL